MRRATRLPLAVLAGLLVGCASRQAGTELEAYFAAIRASGMTEGALSAVQTVASIVAGETLLTFERDPESGRWFRQYQPVSCELPDLTPEQVAALREEQVAKVMREVERIKRLADLDGSGFVTTEEGRRFRQQVELGFEAAFLCGEGPCTLEALAAATGQKPSSVEASLAGYGALQQHAAAAGVRGFPPVPLD